MTDEIHISSHFGRAYAFWRRSWGLPEAKGAEQEADRGAGFALHVLFVRQALADQHRVHEGDQAAHYETRGLRRIDRAELAGFDAVADDELGGIADHFLVRLDRAPAVLDG